MYDEGGTQNVLIKNNSANYKNYLQRTRADQEHILITSEKNYLNYNQNVTLTISIQNLKQHSLISCLRAFFPMEFGNLTVFNKLNNKGMLVVCHTNIKGASPSCWTVVSFQRM